MQLGGLERLPWRAALPAIGWLGHSALWIALNNRVHATGATRKAVKAFSALSHLWLLVGGLAFVWSFVLTLEPAAAESIALWLGPRAGEAASTVAVAMYYYTWPCLAAAAVHFPRWFWQRRGYRPPAALVDEREQTVAGPREIGGSPAVGLRTRLSMLIPGNQFCQFAITERTLAFGGLPDELDGLVVAHLSDLHFSGRLARRYFDALVDRVAQFDADLIALTGDIVDRTACVSWIPATLGRLKAPLGKFFILGNHDTRVADVAALRRTLADSGFADVAERPRDVLVCGRRVLLAGNERPWFNTPLAAPAADYAFKVLLSHSPDQIGWARANGFDLMLAGHTHGGQIRLPWIGPMVCPSRFGVKYASGTFYDPPTLMHVSRGASSLSTVRLNCRPEVTRLVLVRAAAESEHRDAAQAGARRTLAASKLSK